MGFQQSVSWWCYADKGFAPDAFMRLIADIGYAGIELLPPDLFPVAKAHGLTITTHGAFGPLEVGLNKREHFPSIKTQFEETLKLAQQYEIPNLIVFSGNRDGQDDAEGLAITVEGLRQLAPIAEDAGVTLILELLNSKVDHPGYMCDKTAWGVDVVKQVGSPNVKLLYDIYHMQVMEGDIINTIRVNHPYIGHYHTAGVPGRHEIDSLQELNYSAIMQAIADTGYTAFVGQEFVPLGDPVKALKDAYRICSG